MNRLFLFFLTIMCDVICGSAQTSNRCLTPNGENGNCISIYSCSVLYDVITSKDSNTLQFLRASQCGYERVPLVCCGSRATYTTTTTTTTTTSTTMQKGGKKLLPDRNECGFQQFEGKIWNGENTALDEFPWVALLRYRNASGDEQFSCGGTLISSRYILTAAHCVVGQITTRIGTLVSARLGEWNTDTEIDCISSFGFKYCSNDPINVEIEEAIPNEGYDDESRHRYHDIALLRLKNPVTFTEFIQPACLPLASERATIGTDLQVVGWGRTETKRYSPIKQKLKIPVVRQSECRNTYSRAAVSLERTQICAGGQRGKDSCTGDSGGPLLNVVKNTSQYYVEGIVSFGAVCGREGWPGVYTRVSKYLGWIRKNIRP